MKRFFVLCSIMVLSLFLSGCEKTIELTDEENYLIAEYAAELLLKYDRNIDLKYFDESTAYVPEIEEPEITEEPTTEATTETTTEKSEEQVTTEDSNEESITTEIDVKEDISQVIPAKDFDLAKFVGVENVSVKYSHYMILDSYPSYDQDGMYIEIEAPDGYKLLVIKFDMENLTGTSQDVDLYNKDIDYHIIINDSKMAKQMLTILMDDLYTYQGVLDGDMRQENVLLFQLSESVAESIDNLKLKVTYDAQEQIISLQ